MGKRSSFKRRPQDAYDTPYEAVPPLLPFLKKGSRFAEPCAGNGQLIAHLEKHGHVCAAAWDIKPRGKGIEKHDALKKTISNVDYIITNQPWTRSIMLPMIDHFRMMAPTWLLFDADWMHTKQAIPFMPYCQRIVSVGRLKWIPGSPSTGKDNCCWYLFGDRSFSGAVRNPVFTPRLPLAPSDTRLLPSSGATKGKPHGKK